MKKIVSLMAVVMVLIINATQYGYAEEKGKVIFINMNRTNLINMRKIPILKDELDRRGYLAYMNIRGDKGTNDRRSYASMGAGGRANVTKIEDPIIFNNTNKEDAEKFKYVTGKKAKEINYLNVNRSINENYENGEFGSSLGVLGQTLSDNNLKTAVIGNSDIVDNGKLLENRDLCLMAMDQYGRIDMGNIDDINKKDLSMPFGISTDYDKLLSETKKYHSLSDVVYVDLGDTYRLDLYRNSLNDNSFNKMRDNIENKIDEYLTQVFKMAGKNDIIYIASGFPSDIDFKNKRRLTPIIKFKGEGKGLISSATTRRDGITANLDVGVDMLNEFGLKNKLMVGKPFNLIDKNNNVEYLLGEYGKIVSISNVRATIINIFVSVISISWIIATALILIRNRIPNKEKVFNILKELIKLGILMPLSFMIATLFNFKSQIGILFGIFVVASILYLLGRVLFKDDLKHMGFFSGATILLIVLDSILGTYMMKNNIMSYDAIVGARYYGIGNEYGGVIIGSSIFAISVLMNYKEIPKWTVILASLVILITCAYPSMGASVGGAISECVAYLLFIFLIFNMKIDLKRILILGFSAVVVVAVFAYLDIVSGAESHLSGFVQQIMLKGPGQIIQTFTRKIEMNIKIAQTSVWVNILLAGIGIMAVLIFKPSKHFKRVMIEYPIIFKGLVSSVVGCIVALLVNDSGIVAAATASIYIFIPVVIISINMIIFNESNTSEIQ
ncbi:hypothetical protein KQI18_02005 [Clostridioides mangenotii]|uniref:hypothetical protein n=1 Tax=Metaclostridioides mangenotii TaxID=1540 RepID=UPI001C109234|nr:hypothetical protein [Clostridioides mangenotii]MBU5306548.1 hypothetical protein [Clostridioides mangenotii]